MVLTGYTRCVQGDLWPHQIIDQAIAASGDPALLAAHCLAAVDPALTERVVEGDVLVVAGTMNAGPGHEMAVIALQSVGFAAVICAAVAPEVATIASIYGLPILALPEASTLLTEARLVRLDLERGSLTCADTTWFYTPLERATLDAVRRTQLLTRMRRVVEDEGYAE
ncbi:hypothetical protein [Candidatus Chloroploca asiatica]|uniref:Aconitase A/isopropylmalate dehydratase small subunit swivel domain-containing protein n=1 Tax=Candidatus Chloroploca asiatica TaxID=1506545 RepID=A0A2H3L881_9CHLR|nr:hypothetical protein [Candidatus Chloroploca asiatica]PDV99505.1 hypothetical protein A9Q02_11990 [Candidatus Chloroploca asiatica]